MKKEAVRGWIEEIGVIPAVRVSSAEDALFAAEAVASTEKAERGQAERRNYRIVIHLALFATAMVIPFLLIVTFMLITAVWAWTHSASRLPRAVLTAVALASRAA